MNKIKEENNNDSISRIRQSIASRPSHVHSNTNITAASFNTTPINGISNSNEVEKTEQLNIDEIKTQSSNSPLINIKVVHSRISATSLASSTDCKLVIDAREDSIASLNFGNKDELDNHTNRPVPPEVKEWLRETFSSVSKSNIHASNPRLGKLTNTLKKFSANIFGKSFLCCASCCCLNCIVGDDKVNDVAKRITIATSSNSKPQVTIDRKTIRKTRRNSLLLREQIATNNMLQQQEHPIVYNEKDSKLMIEYHRDRLRKHLTYPNNVKFRSKKPPFSKKIVNFLKYNCFCICYKNDRNKVERPSITSMSQRSSIRSINRITDMNSVSSFSNKKLPPKVKLFFKDQINLWEFNIFKLPTEGHTPLKWMILELLSKYQLIEKFNIPLNILDNFCHELEQGYQVFDNQYHNARHAADVVQTIHHILIYPGLLHWLTSLEIFSLIIAAAAHDLEHTGTTNNFHIKTRSDLATLYNDKSPLENHHVACLFSYLNEPHTNICVNMTESDYNEFRTLVVDMILGTDMQQHFKQLNKMQDSLKNFEKGETLKKGPAMCLILHSADISNPAKPYSIHRRWTDSLLEEYFTQGDDEITMGFEASPLCDRVKTNIPSSQIGFIEYIVGPCFNTLHDMFVMMCKEVQNKNENKNLLKNDEEKSNDEDVILTWAESKKGLLSNQGQSFELIEIDDMEKRINEFSDKIKNILNYNSNLWKRQLDKVKEDEEKAKQRREIDERIDNEERISTINE